MKAKYLILILIISIIIISCKNNPRPNYDGKSKIKINQSGFVLTFDDAYVDEWYQIRTLLKRYKVKATFFVSGFHNLSNLEISKLKVLEKDGHEIACHSVNHFDAVKFVNNASIKTYLNTEILPELILMKENGFKPTSFAYPYGRNNSVIDSILLKHFTLLRDVTESQRHFYSMFLKDVDDIDEIYFDFDSSKVISALGIDNNFNISINEIRYGFIRAKQNNEVIILYAHKPVKNITSSYQITYNYLENILNIAQHLGLKSYRFKDLMFK